MAMFGLLVSGRLVDTNFREVDPAHCVIDIQHPEILNHVVVFLTGQSPFPEGTGGAVYCSWPSTDTSVSEPVWQFLGTISNEKPSAIFKVSRLKHQNHSHSAPLGFGRQSLEQVAQVGISVESLSTLANLSSATSESEASNVSSALEFSQKMVESLFNYVVSFAASADEARLKTSEAFVPISSVQQWFANFERRLQQNPTFWKS